ncbi:MAG: UPF0175 family protein [Pseudomonadota bacterium]
MRTIGIKELKINPGLIAKALNEQEYVMITRHGRPLGLVTSFDNQVLDVGLKQWLCIKAYAVGDLSLGQLAKCLELTKAETMQALSELGVPVADYNLQEDLETIEQLR